MYFTLALLGFAIVSLYWVKSLRSRRPPLPPGPPGRLLIGHVKEIRYGIPEDQLNEWGKTYGDILYFHFLGKPLIVLNSVEAAVDLLDKRGYNYSDRPRFVLYELLGWDRMLAFLKYGKKFQEHRRLIQRHLNKNTAASYKPIQMRETNVLLQRLLAEDISWTKIESYLQVYSAGIIIRMVYGHQITSDEDPYVSALRNVTQTVNKTGAPASTPIDFFPFLARLPAWFPGAFYGGFARDNRSALETLYNVGFDRLKQDIAQGKAKSCFMAHEIEALERDGCGTYDILDLQGAASTMYVAGSDTTWSTLSFFFLAMVLFPEFQERAQKEIDIVIGSGRLPEISDRPFLPFVECIMQETLRWHSALPLGVPHYSLEDDVYNGMFIPKGSIIVANARAMAIDERVYKNPRTFDPTRYFCKPEGNGEPYPNGPFGFGRRICPGRHMAEASVWIAMASILASFTISKAIGPDGKEITPKESVTFGFTSQPEPFQCRIQPRSAQAKTLIMNADTSDNY